MSNLIPHQFSNVHINQLSEDTVIGGKLIPKGYVNLTQMCKANKKQIKHWNENKSAQEFIAELTTLVGIPTDLLTIVITDGANDERGTWGHHLVAIDLARWISPKFAVWANKVLWAVINGDFTAQTAEAQEAQERLQALWQEVRNAGKASRRALTDSIKDWYDRNPDATSRPIHAMYAHTTNGIYQALWGKTAVEIEAILGCNRNESRNYMTAGCLKVLDRAEARVCEFIDDDNIKPVDAVLAANLKRTKQPLVD